MKLRYLRNVTSLELNKEACTGCGICVNVCPHEVLVLQNKKAEIVDRDACMECGACAMNCPFDAISVNSGVGCAAALINGKLTGRAPSCDCSGDCCG